MDILRRLLLGILGGGGAASVEINTTCPAITPTLGAELLTNNTFDTDTVWNKGAGWTISGGVGVGTAAGTLLRQTGKTTAGNWYQAIWEMVSRVDGTISGFPGVGGLARSSTGVFTTTARATGTNAGINGTNFTGTVDNIYCKQITFSTMLVLLGDIQRKDGTYICHPTQALDSQCGMSICYADENNLVLAYINRSDGKAYLDSRISGTWANARNGAITYGDEKELKVIVSGTTFKLYYDGVQVGADATIAIDSLGTKVQGFNSLASNTVGVVTTSV